MFIDTDGDANYFSDMTDGVALCSINSIRSSFQRLKGLERRLTALTVSCERSTKMVSTIYCLYAPAYMMKLSLRLKSEISELTGHAHSLNLQAHNLNLQTNVISRDIHGLNRIGTEATIKTVRAAQETSRSTRTNVMIIWVGHKITALCPDN